MKLYHFGLPILQIMACLLIPQSPSKVDIKVTPIKPPIVVEKPAVVIQEPRAPIARERAEGIKGYAQRRVTEEFGANHWSAFESIVQRESGWNYHAWNKSSTACGLMQAMPCSKVGGVDGLYWNNDKEQIEWGIKYIAGRYGNPNNAQVWWNNHHWY